jgi:hypothetical protein
MTSESALLLGQEIFSLWGQGGFHNEEKEANFDKYFSADLVIDYRLNTSVPELKVFDGIFKGRQGFFQNMGIHTVFEWSDMKYNIFVGPENSYMIHMDALPVKRSNGKVANGRILCLLQGFVNEEGKVFKVNYYFINAQGLDSAYP